MLLLAIAAAAAAAASAFVASAAAADDFAASFAATAIILFSQLIRFRACFSCFLPVSATAATAITADDDDAPACALSGQEILKIQLDRLVRFL